MPAGLQTFKADGTVSLDTNFRTGRILGSTTLGPNGSFSVAVSPGAGKSIWVHGYVVGDQGYSYNYANGVLSIQTGGGAGSVYFFYGER